MALEGTFKDFGLAEIFQLIGLQKKTGVLTAKSVDGEQVVTVAFDKGMVTVADEFHRGEQERLGSILLRSRLITKEALERAVQTQKETLQRLGHVLTQMGFITRQDLRQALQTQVKEAIYRLFRWKEGSYHFSSEAVTYDREMYQPIAAEFLLMEGVRMIDEWPIIEKKISSFEIVFEKVPGKAEPKTGDGSSEAGEEGWDDLMEIVDEGEGGARQKESGRGPQAKLSPQEQGIFLLVDGERTVQDIIDEGKIGEFETCKVLYGFLSVGLIRPLERAATRRPVREASRRPFIPLGDVTTLLVVLVGLLAALLFNPWSMLSLGYNVQQSRNELGALRDEVLMQRLRYGLEVFYLEKQTYPIDLDKLSEDRLVEKEDLRDSRKRPFTYQGSEEDYQLGRE